MLLSRYCCVGSTPSLGHDGAGNHEHASGEELHDPIEDKVENPVPRDWIHLCEDSVVHGLGTKKVSGRPGSHDTVCNSDTKDGKADADAPEKL